MILTRQRVNQPQRAESIKAVRELPRLDLTLGSEGDTVVCHQYSSWWRCCNKQCGLREAFEKTFWAFASKPLLPHTTEVQPPQVLTLSDIIQMYKIFSHMISSVNTNTLIKICKKKKLKTLTLNKCFLAHVANSKAKQNLVKAFCLNLGLLYYHHSDYIGSKNKLLNTAETVFWYSISQTESTKFSIPAKLRYSRAHYLIINIDCKHMILVYHVKDQWKSGRNNYSSLLTPYLFFLYSPLIFLNLSTPFSSFSFMHLFLLTLASNQPFLALSTCLHLHACLPPSFCLLPPLPSCSLTFREQKPA